MLAAAENSLIEALRNHRDVKRLVRTVDTLPKQTSEQLLKRYYVDAPALYVIPGRFIVKDNAATLRFTIAGVVRNVAGQDKARKGDGVDIGCDNLAILAIRALNDQCIGICTWFVTSGEMIDDEIFDTAGVAAIELTLESTPIELPSDFGEEQISAQISALFGNAASEESEGGLDEFQHLHADFDLNTDAGQEAYAKWLSAPPDFSTSQPDMQLDVQLPGATP